MKKVVVITGVSKGLGKAFAKKFKEEGFYIVGISRTKPDIDIDFHISADLVKDDKKEIVERIIKKTDRIDVLINNAGVGLYESWENMKEDDLRYLFELNFFSVVFLTKEMLPFLEKTKGTVINVSSVAGKISLPFMGGYCASKYALNAFSYSLRGELFSKNINVLNLIVGRINTGFSSRSLGSLKPPETPFGGSAEKLAKETYKAYLKRKREIVYPKWYKGFILLYNLLPDFFLRKAVEKWKKPQ